jgi:hypothetical protein
MKDTIMKKEKQIIGFGMLFLLICFAVTGFSQAQIEAGDPPNNLDIPDFYKSRLSDIDEELRAVSKGTVKAVAISPGGLPVYAVYYGEKEGFHSQANYNSAVAARNPVYFAKKDSATKPVIFFLGPVHGQEVEGIVGMVNLIHIAETGKDHRGKEWPSLKEKWICAGSSLCRVETPMAAGETHTTALLGFLPKS